MPTILRSDGFRVCVYPNDHRPAHVHVVGNGCEVVFNLNCPDGPPEERENYGFARRELVQVKAIVMQALRELCVGWERIHGRY